ncbi:MAG: hypothetical protein R3B90_06295 [Planctomycetaceae bacterium]
MVGLTIDAGGASPWMVHDGFMLPGGGRRGRCFAVANGIVVGLRGNPQDRSTSTHFG